jgi:hypothetical protein
MRFLLLLIITSSFAFNQDADAQRLVCKFRNFMRCNPNCFVDYAQGKRVVPEREEVNAILPTESYGDDLIITPLTEEIFVSGDLTEASIKKDQPIAVISEAAVRVTVSGVCGSGTIVGKDKEGNAIVLTNAHVAGVRKGRTVNLRRWGMDGKEEVGVGEIIAAGYKRGASLDYSVLKCLNGFGAKVVPIPLSINLPDKTKPMTNTGCPRCEWPSMQVIRMIRDTGQVLSWQPEAISGRSGSSIVQHGENGARIVGLLTWAGGGNGLGQSSTMILDSLSGRTPKSLEVLPSDVREIAYVMQEEEANQDIVDDISEKPEDDKGIFKNKDKDKGKIRDKIKEKRPGQEEQRLGLFGRFFQFIRRLFVTVILCACSFVGGYLYAKFRSK